VRKKAPAGEPPAEARSNTTEVTARADSDTPARQAGYSRRRHRIRWLSDYEPLPLTEHQLAGAETAAEHLLAHQLPPLFPLPVIRAIWGRNRDLARKLARIRGLT
jgi:hypothetical protein